MTIRRVSRRPVGATAIVVLGVLCFEVWSWQLGRERLAGFPLPPAGGSADIEIVLPLRSPRHSTSSGFRQPDGWSRSTTARSGSSLSQGSN